MGKIPVYHATGFRLLGAEAPIGRRTALAAIVSIAKGDALHDDGAGLLTNAITDLTITTFAGIAAEDVDNSGDSGYSVQYYPFVPQTQFYVPVEEAAVLTRTMVGTIVDLQSVNTIDQGEAITAGIGFRIDEIDISTEAIAANTYGYAIGHFELVYAS